MCQDIFGTVRQSRRLSVYLAFAAALMAVYLSVTLSGGALIIGLAGIYLALVLRRLVLNPGSGFRLGQDRIDWYSTRGRESAPLEALESVSIGQSHTGQTLCILTLTDGRTVRLSGIERIDERRLMREFGRRGVRIIA